MEDIITFDDIYSIGPLTHLHERQGQETRMEWLRHVMSNEFGRFDDMVIDQQKMIQQVKDVKDGSHMMIWIGNNAHEQIGLRFAIYLLKGKNVDVSVINTAIAYDHHFNTKTIRMDLRHTGEIPSEKFKIIYESKNHFHTISKEERERLQEEWLHIAETDHTLRIWRNEQTLNVSEDEFDAYLVKMAKRLHPSEPEEEYIVTPRLIGEVLGHLEQYIGDDFIEYRLKKLIDQGVFAMKGKRTSMRYYSIN